MDSDKVDIFDPGVIMIFIIAFFSDLSFLGILGLVVPVVGFAIVALIVFAHYALGIIVIAFMWKKIRGWFATALLLAAWILPLPFLCLGIALSVIASNKLAALILEQVAIQAIAVATAGAGEALEGAAVAGEAAEVAVEATEAVSTAAEGAQAVGEVAETAGAVGETGAQAAQAGAEAGVEGGAEAGVESTAGAHGEDLMASPEEGNPMENLQEELTEPREESFAQKEEPIEEKPEQPKNKKDEARKIMKKVQDVTEPLDRAKNQDRDEEGDKEEVA